MKDIASKFAPEQIENKWYNFWKDNGFFKSRPDHRNSYTVIMPPPNVTGVLHMGHVLNNTIQDVLVRKARMSGFNVSWIPGSDHASIATEAKVVHKLREEGKTKSQLGRDQFLSEAWNWTHHHGGIIFDQIEKMGASVDWDKKKFTLDEDMYKAVIKCFVQLYNDGYVYRDYKMLNWDPVAKTTISDEEVVHKDQQTRFVYIKYPIVGTDQFVTIATVRPETILADVAVCVHPDDPRFSHLIGKEVTVPIANRNIPIIQDDYVDIEMGTGCLKITPAHDFNDYQIGQTHGLPFIDMLNDDGTLNEHGLHYKDMSREEARSKIIKELESIEAIEKIEQYTNKVGTSERTGAVIEPKRSLQWFVKMKDLAEPALKVVMERKVELIPNKFENTYKHWLENIKDWNISRQLWWGHRIPAYYYGNGVSDFVVAETEQEALLLAQEKSGNKTLSLTDLKQEEDVLDTWFSSWLWPISTLGGMDSEPNQEWMDYYYPTKVLVTAPEIIFFWVARMVMAGLYFEDKIPFEKVYLTGIVRDKKGQKMSKSLGNSPDPIELMKQYGADGVRMGMLFSSPAGNDLLFDEKLCEQGRNFNNKLWNSFRLVSSWQIEDNQSLQEVHKEAIYWFDQRLNQVLSKIDKALDEFRLSDALMMIYSLIWDDYCSVYLESMKPEFGGTIPKQAYDKTVEFLETLVKILHPFAPFISEEIWQTIQTREVSESLIVQSWPKVKEVDVDFLTNFEFTRSIVTEIRDFRAKHNIAFKEPLSLQFQEHGQPFIARHIVQKLTNIDHVVPEISSDTGYSFRVHKGEFHIPFQIDEETKAKEQEIMKEELQYALGFLKSVQGKLKNERFVNNAPEQVVALERKKEADTLQKIELLKTKLGV